MSAWMEQAIVMALLAGALVVVVRSVWGAIAPRGGCGCAGKGCARLAAMERALPSPSGKRPPAPRQ
jgi:hypothetical protein